MAFLDSAGNVDPTAGAVVQQWVAFHAAQSALDAATKGHIAAPATVLPVGAEKASKRS